ncbi:MAG: hypothetical protein ACRDUA_00415 [Micromonosporaceae bacterium]
MIRSVAALDTAYGTEAGDDVLYTTVNGSPASFQVVDLDTYQLLRTIPLPGTTSAWSHTVDPDGNVVIASSGKLFRYSPATKQVEDLGQVPGAVALYGVATDSDGDIVVGTYPDAKVVRWDSATRTYLDLGTVADGQEHVRGMAYRDGVAYAGTGTTRQPVGGRRRHRHPRPRSSSRTVPSTTRTQLGTTLTVVDPKKLTYRKLADRAEIMTFADDGAIYYAAGTDLMRIRTGRPAAPR